MGKGAFHRLKELQVTVGHLSTSNETTSCCVAWKPFKLSCDDSNTKPLSPQPLPGRAELPSNALMSSTLFGDTMVPNIE